MPRSSASPSAAAKPFELHRKWTAAQQIYDDLRNRIISLDLEPGSAVSRAELASFYGVSPTPLRDAMMKLEQEGLLDIRPQSKTLVTKIDCDSARETQFLRTAIELEVIRTLAETPGADLDEPQRLLDAMTACGFDDDGLTEFTALDRAFHRALCTAAGHESLWDLVVRRSGHLDRLRRLHLPSAGKREQIIHDHAAILDGIRSGDPAEATAHVRRHLSGTLQVVDRIAAAHPDYF